MTNHTNKLYAMLLTARRVAAATTILVFGSTGLAQSTVATLVNPGLWEIAPQSSAGASVLYQLCFARGDVEDLKNLLPNLSNSVDCPEQRIDASTGAMTWEFSCPAKSFYGEGRYQLNAGTIRGAISFTQGAPAVTTSHSIAARHLGVCPSR